MNFRTLLFWATMLGSYGLGAQRNVTFTLQATQTKPISNLIYGVNGAGGLSYPAANINASEVAAGATSRRWGGDRASTYNWETNHSTSGAYGGGYDSYNDNWAPSIWGLSNSAGYNAVLKAFHDRSLSTNTHTLLSLQLLGYVPADGNGTQVTAAQAAPSSRFRTCAISKPTGQALSLTPSTTDGNVYQDEMLNELKNWCTTNGKAFPNAFSLDNESSIWNGTHVRFHPSVVTCQEYIQKSVDASRMVKSIFPQAEVIGGVWVNYAAYQDFTFDWAAGGAGNGFYTTYQSNYSNYNKAYLSALRDASISSNKKLLDVIDFHWYPAGTPNVDNDVTTQAVAEARMQYPRSLDDNTFTEQSWITQYNTNYTPINFLGKMQADIDAMFANNPQFKPSIGCTEWRFGGGNHISGGIAAADVLGRFAKNGLYMAHIFEGLNEQAFTYWSTNNVAAHPYLASAYKLFRNYNGTGGTFGDVWVANSSSETNTNSNRSTTGCSNFKYSETYISKESGNANRWHVVSLNKHYTQAAATTLDLSGAGVTFTSARVYGFDQSSSTVRSFNTSVTLTNNRVSFTVPPLSAYHVELTAATPSGLEEEQNDASLIAFPNPCEGSFEINTPEAAVERVNVLDMLGRSVSSQVVETENGVSVQLLDAVPGMYLVQASLSDGKQRSGKVLVRR